MSDASSDLGDARAKSRRLRRRVLVGRGAVAEPAVVLGLDLAIMLG